MRRMILSLAFKKYQKIQCITHKNFNKSLKIILIDISRYSIPIIRLKKSLQKTFISFKKYYNEFI